MSIGDRQILNRKIVIGTMQGQNVTIEIRIDEHDNVKRDKMTVDLERASSPYYTLSMSGSLPHESGQCGDRIQEALDDGEITPALSQETVEGLLEIWCDWHLNDLKAGTRRQMEIVQFARKDYSAQCEKLRQHDLLEDGGYEYGAGWLVDSLPETVISFLRNLPANPEAQASEEQLDEVGAFSFEFADRKVTVSSEFNDFIERDVGLKGKRLMAGYFTLRVSADPGDEASFDYYTSHNDCLAGKDDLTRRDMLWALQCILMDAMYAEEMDLENFRKEFGYDLPDGDEDHTRDIYNKCLDTLEKLKRISGGDVQFVENLRDDIEGRESTNFSGIPIQPSQSSPSP